MANYKEDIVDIELTNGTIHRAFSHKSIGAGDELANRFGVRTFRNGQPENISGSCIGLFIRADGTTVAINNGTVNGNVAYVTLPEACYAVEGVFTLAIKITGGGTTGTLRIIDGMVSRTSTDETVDPGTIMPSIEDLIAAIEAAEATIPSDYSAISVTINDFIVNYTKLEQGQYTGDDGKASNSTRIRLIDPIRVPKGTVLHAAIGDLYWLIWELSSNETTGGNVITATGWNSDTTYTVQNDCWVMMSFANGATVETSTSITVDDFITYWIAVKRIGDDGLLTNITNLLPLADIKSLLTDDTLIAYDHLEQGQFTGNNGKGNNNTRIRLIKPIRVPKGTVFNASIGDLYWLIWELSSSRTTGGNVITATAWNRETTYTVQNDCWIMMSFANGATVETSTRLTVDDFRPHNVSISKIGQGVSYEITALKQRSDLKKLPELYISDFIQAALTASGFTESTERLSTIECVALPYGKHTILHVEMNGDYLLGVRAGQLPQNLSSNKWWYQNGDTITFEGNEQYYRLSIARRETSTEYSEITLDELPVIGLHITYEYEENIADVNEGLETFINAANGLSSTSHGDLKAFPVIAHVSDVHGDYKRLKNAIEVSNICNADALVLSGDVVANVPSNGVEWMHDLIQESIAPTILCTGNHEVNQNGITDAEVYSYFMEPSAELIGNADGKTYYYTDIPSAKLRIISADLYQFGATTRSNAHMTSEQLTYICNALLGTPEEYGVIVVSHTPCVDVRNLMDSNYPTFFQQLRKYGFTHYDIDGAPIYDIIDAFIGRTTINRTYTQTGSPSSISVSANFSGVSQSIEFIAHMTGHIHEDSVCYLPTTHKQLMLNIECGVCLHGGSAYPYMADDCDTTRIPRGKSQNAINMYVIDRSTKKIKIIRIGASKTYDRKTREYMEIPYSD